MKTIQVPPKTSPSSLVLLNLHIPCGKVSKSSYVSALCTPNHILQSSSLGLITNIAYVIYEKIIVLRVYLVQTLHDPYQS
jgi:hypothetical protein